MKRLFLFMLVLCVCFAQAPQGRGRIDREEDPKLPNGKSQHEEIIKADYKKNLDDAAALATLAEQLKADLDRSDRNIVSIKMIKQTEEIEKLARNIRGRLKRY
jgi:ATP-dependent helicase/DNAse subunit B